MRGRGYQCKPRKSDEPPAKPGDDHLVELHRVRVRELESRAYLPQQIASVLRIPYRVVEAILSTPAKPKKPVE